MAQIIYKTYLTKGGRTVVMPENDPYTIKALASGDYKEVKEKVKTQSNNESNENNK